jgi:uncharacterized protein (TIGR00255 family)
VVNLPSALASLESDLRAKMDRSSSWPDHRYDLRLRSRGAPSTGRRFRPAALDLALEQLLQMRAKEGSNLHKELLRRIRSIGRALSKIRKLQPRVAKRYRALLFERVRKIGPEITFDDDRLTKDVTFFAERSDFSEELSWLESHLDQFLETTNKQPAIGRTLEFISQELGRELNTLSAKAKRKYGQEARRALNRAL